MTQKQTTNYFDDVSIRLVCVHQVSNRENHQIIWINLDF